MYHWSSAFGSQGKTIRGRVRLFPASNGEALGQDYNRIQKS